VFFKSPLLTCFSLCRSSTAARVRLVPLSPPQTCFSLLIFLPSIHSNYLLLPVQVKYCQSEAGCAAVNPCKTCCLLVNHAISTHLLFPVQLQHCQGEAESAAVTPCRHHKLCRDRQVKGVAAAVEGLADKGTCTRMQNAGARVYTGTAG
jgi:hypothetical protein